MIFGEIDLASTGNPQVARTQARAWFSEVLGHIREEYDEMPGLCLTLPQAQRLWALDAHTCRRAIDSLVEAGFLRASPFGYVRARG